ncbi:putative Patatin family phospholipase [Aspergillus saccharolyticus JOP 1030-1]|uniref:Patatin-like phospholipase domain-containing protein n=1 Tax=Aspergillus saccharolyticus JOP 1030-1 TaxID=1450539 RepID=A0A318ZIK8_9EURO|nr:patatin family phospholipase [Aspergillus saccharolyticus JOP 1030-1]PYH47349.1 patatin family phospholipase [Aspergillus saccharolyticus JOP 1030-1]
MSIIHDPTVVRTQCNSKSRRRPTPDAIRDTAARSRRSLLKSLSVPSLSSVVKSSLTWAGDTWNYRRDGSCAEQRQESSDREDRKQVLYLKMRNAVTYEEWRSCASELDDLEEHTIWKETLESPDYDVRLIQERLKQLEDARISCDVSRMLFLIRTSLSRDLGNMSNASLYRHSHLGTKDLIDRYITTALDTISSLVELSGQNRCDGLETKYILDQLLAARQAFGRSALLFSGGATFGMNHIGVLKALYEAKLLPRIISGASAGSIVCAVFCTRTEDELPALLDSYAYGDFAVFGEESETDNILQKTARFLKYGSFLDITHLAKLMRSWLGDITFQEAYNRTRRILNICVSSAGVYELPKLLNYITAPNVLIWSAVAVSCSVPLIFSPSELMAKDPITGEPTPWHDLHKQYIDGSVDGDLPMNRLSEMFNVNHFIVSQVNPHVVPFLPRDNGPNQQGQSLFTAPQWLHTATHLAKDELLYRLTVLSELGICPTALTKTMSIVNQKYSGDINIYPEILYSHFPVILKNPTTEFMLQACLCGERATWPKLGRIRNHCAIELALDMAVQQMRARVAFCPGEVRIRSDSSLDSRSLESLESSGGRGRMLNRRSSYSHELERRKLPKQHNICQATPYLQRSRSVFLSKYSQSIDGVSLARQDHDLERSTQGEGENSSSTGDESYSAESDTDEEPLPSFSERLQLSKSWRSWEPCSQDHPYSLLALKNGSLSSQSTPGLSSSSGHSARSPFNGIAIRSPEYATCGMHETSLSPSRHLLRMTPTTHAKTPSRSSLT